MPSNNKLAPRPTPPEIGSPVLIRQACLPSATLNLANSPFALAAYIKPLSETVVKSASKLSPKWELQSTFTCAVVFISFNSEGVSLLSRPNRRSDKSSFRSVIDEHAFSAKALNSNAILSNFNTSSPVLLIYVV